MRIGLPALFALSLAACGQPGGAPPDAAATQTPSPTPAPIESLVGEYRVAGIDGYPLNEPYGVAVSITSERIDFDNCRQIGWRYTFEGDRLETERSPPDGPDAKPCEEKLPVFLLQMVSAIDAAKKAERSPQNGVALKGGLRSVTLFSQ